MPLDTVNVFNTLGIHYKNGKLAGFWLQRLQAAFVGEK